MCMNSYLAHSTIFSQLPAVDCMYKITYRKNSAAAFIVKDLLVWFCASDMSQKPYGSVLFM